VSLSGLSPARQKGGEQLVVAQRGSRVYWLTSATLLFRRSRQRSVVRQRKR